ncbi:guanylate cyclase soluble subunit alpha-2-like [Haliotis rufescens]|uniref:guanylate cyclase soluble subunit alpha-2-like n=1 Tax=Haliotis rufescens TaxID=6454 RepID=UPI001EAFECAA|nr:guanylate cyclase soluble subunit alpha-2-like [Haliotis rufescens]
MATCPFKEGIERDKAKLLQRSLSGQKVQDGQPERRTSKETTSSDESPRSRKISNISTASSGGSDETGDGSGDRTISLTGLIEGVGTLVIPANGFVFTALQKLLTNSKKPGAMEHLRSQDFFPTDFDIQCSDLTLRHSQVDDNLVVRMAEVCSEYLGLEVNRFMAGLGMEYFMLCFEQYGKELHMVGSSMFEFFSNVDGLNEHIRKTPKFHGDTPASFRCEYDRNTLLIHYYSSRRKLLHMMLGTITAVAKVRFSMEVEIKVSPNRSPDSPHQIFIITIITNNNDSNNTLGTGAIQDTVSANPSDSQIGVATFCRTFPFHVVFDRDLQITQLGSAFMKTIAPEMATKGLELSTYFEILRPEVKMNFSALLSRINFSFLLLTKTSKSMDIKGQMIYLPAADAIMFIGSPSVEKLDELIGKGIYISDIPIHDATRDVILVGEQTKAQDGLKRRMETLKKSIMEASVAVDTEKQKNVSLLQDIFPPEIAQKLWRGESVEPMKIDDVTMLFSDLVGFTAICSTATPMQVVNMLNSLYTHFDNYCGLLDVYKIETIGDAYCVAGGLHRASKYHALQIAWMAIKMMKAAASQKAHDGGAIKMRIGIHTGSVLAGVVGTKMPRYCLFGNNVTITNKFESGSVALKINVSPISYNLLRDTPGFNFIPRTREDLPPGFPENVEGVPLFLESYTHPGVPESDIETTDHIALALEHYDLSAER